MKKANYYFDESWILSSSIECKKLVNTMRQVGSFRRKTVEFYQPENIEPKKTPHVSLIGDVKRK